MEEKNKQKTIESINPRRKGQLRVSKLYGIDKSAFFNKEMPPSLLKIMTSKFKIEKKELLPFCHYETNDLVNQLGQQYRAMTASH